MEKKIIKKSLKKENTNLERLTENSITNNNNYNNYNK